VFKDILHRWKKSIVDYTVEIMINLYGKSEKGVVFVFVGMHVVVEM
jgi:hypothetical protein